MSFLEGNMKLVGSNVLEALRTKRRSTYEYVVRGSHEGSSPVAHVSFEDREIRLHANGSSYDDNGMFEQLEVFDGTTYIVFGFGLGYHLDILVRKCRLHKNVKIVVIEPLVELFEVAAQARNLTDVLSYSHLTVLLPDSYQELERGLSRALSSDLLIEGRVKVLFLNSLVYNLPVYREMIKYTKDFLNVYIINRNTRLRFAEAWTINAFTNVSSVLKSRPIKNLFGKFNGVPVVMVAAGPSLDKNINLLPRAKGKALIICAGTALPPVLAQGIEPDLVFALDGGEAQGTVFKNSESQSARLCYAPSVFPSVPHLFGDRLMVFSHGSSIPWIRKFCGDFGTILGGPSVANFMFEFATRVGEGPVILIGQDLAVDGTRSHASGTVCEEGAVGNVGDLLEVDGVQGNRVLTRRDFHTMLITLNKQVEAVAAGVDIIDATEGGALIRGTRVMPFGEALNSYVRDYKPIERLMADNLGETVGTMVDVPDMRGSLTRVLSESRVVRQAARKGFEQGLEIEALFLQHKATRAKVDRNYSRLLDSLHTIKENEEFASAAELLLSKCMTILDDANVTAEQYEPMSPQWGVTLGRGYQRFFAGLVDSCDVISKVLSELPEISV